MWSKKLEVFFKKDEIKSNPLIKCHWCQLKVNLSNLFLHCERTHNEQTKVCLFCGVFAFNNLRELRRHVVNCYRRNKITSQEILVKSNKPKVIFSFVLFFFTNHTYRNLQSLWCFASSRRHGKGSPRLSPIWSHVTN